MSGNIATQSSNLEIFF